MFYKVKCINDFSWEELNNFYKRIYTYKKMRIDKQINEDIKKRAIIGELLLAELLNEHYGLNYDNLEFEINSYGKAYIKGKNIFFNISHSYNYVAVVVSDKEVGIDIEKIRVTSLNTVKRFATFEEKEYIFSSKDNVYERLFEIYTLKEAYYKRLGIDLSNMKSVKFYFKNGHIICSDAKVKIILVKDISDYVLAICM